MHLLSDLRERISGRARLRLRTDGPSVSRAWLVLMPLICLSVHSLAQQHGMAFRRFGLRDGLSQSSVNSVVQDQQGFMWFGTQDGLSRYDGSAFRVFTANTVDSSGPSDNYIWKILASPTGHLWIGTYSGGLNRFDPATESFTPIRIVPESLATPPTRNVTSLYEDQDGTLWFGTWGGGLFHMVRSGSGEVRYVRYARTPGDSHSLVDNRIADIRSDREGNLWVATWGGVSCLRRGSFTNYRHDPRDTHSLSDDNVWALALDSSGSLWLGTWGGGVCRYDRVNDRFIRYPLGRGSARESVGKSISALHTDGRGVLWVGTSGGGLFRYERVRDQFVQVRHDPFDPESLAGDGVLSLAGDRDGGLWVGHEAAGVSYHDPRRDRFVHYRHVAGDNGSLSHDNIRALAEDGKGGIWVGMRGGGVDYLRRGASQFMHFRQRPADPGSLSSDLVLSVLVRRNGDVLVGTQQGGLDLLVAGSRSFRHFLHDARDAQSISNNSVSALYEDRDGNVWVGTNGGGLDLFDAAHSRFVHSGRPGAPGNVVDALSIWTINEDRQGNLWVGTWGMGLYRLTAGTERVTVFRNNPADTASLANNTVFSVTEDEDGLLWVGTEGGGLNCLDPRTLRFKRFTVRDGLPNNVIYGVLPDGRGNLWLSTNRGLVRFDPDGRTMRTYDIADGLQSNEFNQNAYCRTADGRLCFGGIGGFNVIDPQNIPPDGPPPRVVLTNFMLFGKQVRLPRALPFTDRLVVSYDQDILSFEFAALDFAAPERNQYTYMLDGFDRDWIQGGNRPFAGYTRLPGGDYVFRVRGSNSDGVWNLDGAAIALRVVPPYWRTWWFSALVVLAGLGLLIVLYRYRVRHLVEIERMRIRIASDLHDDIGSGLTRIAVQSEIIQNTVDPSLVRSASGRIGAASREIIATMSDVIWSIDARNDTWQDLLDRMRDCGTEIFAGTSTELTINEKGIDRKQSIPVDVRQNLYMIFKEALSNCARHAEARHVTVNMEQSGGWFSLSIADDGKGMGSQARQGGQGLRNMRMRADRIRATLRIEGPPGVRIFLSMKA